MRLKKQGLTPIIAATSLLLTACGTSSDGGTTTVPNNGGTTTNSAPVANAGPDQNVSVGTFVSLDGSNSTDANGDALTYQWQIISQPSNVNTVLHGDDTAQPNFTASSAGSYVIGLTVNDGKTLSVQDTLTIVVSGVSQTNTAPVANAGADQNTLTGQIVNLSGSGSSDAENDNLSYQWSIVIQPNGSSVSIDNAQNSNSSFIPSIAGSYVIALIVNDGELDSVQDTITIVASTATEPQSADITDAEFTNRSNSCADYAGEFFANVKDIKRNLGFEGNITISVVDNKCRFISNEIPNHDFNDNSAQFATNVSEQSANFEIPVQASFAPQTTGLDLGVTNAIMLNGVEVDILPAACYGVGNEPLGQEKIGCGPDQIDNPWRYDPMSPLNGFGTDMHNAHTQPSGKYHYHGNPLAMFNVNCEASGEASPVIGFAADGFPVYGPCFQDPTTKTVKKAKSSFVLKNNGGQRQAVQGYTTPVGGVGDIASNNYDGQFRGDWEFQQGQGDLDECNGMTINGQYGYYVTDSFPWIIGCYKGALDSSFVNTGPRLQRLMHRHGDGPSHRHE